MNSHLRIQTAKYVLIVILLVGLITLIPVTTTAVATENQTEDDAPGVPASYYGTVMINGEPAPANTTIEAVVDNEIQGSITTETAGKYGGPNASDHKLTVSGEFDQQGTEVVFKINADDLQRGEANQTAIWNSGEIGELNLTAELETSDTNGNGGDDGGGAGAAPAPAPEPSPPTNESEDNESVDQLEEDTQSEPVQSNDTDTEESETSPTNQESEDEIPGFGFIITVISILSVSILFSNSNK